MNKFVKFVSAKPRVFAWVRTKMTTDHKLFMVYSQRTGIEKFFIGKSYERAIATVFSTSAFANQFPNSSSLCFYFHFSCQDLWQNPSLKSRSITCLFLTPLDCITLHYTVIMLSVSKTNIYRIWSDNMCHRFPRITRQWARRCKMRR